MEPTDKAKYYGEVTLDRVRKLYWKVINVQEYYHPVNRWTSILKDGTDIRDPKNYYELMPGATSSHEVRPDNIERVVEQCIAAGAVKIQFRCRDAKKEECFPDYFIHELVKDF